MKDDFRRKSRRAGKVHEYTFLIAALALQVGFMPSALQVTGANKGIGFAIVKGLCEQLRDQGIVYLAG